MTPYAEAVAWLYGFADRGRGVGWNPRSARSPEWALRRTRVLLDLSGAPDRRLAVVLVAGTNGKGSTAALLASVLSASGVRTGLYTQPHLQSDRERVRIDGEAIGESAFAQGIDGVRPLVPELHRTLPDAGEPSAFELGTVLALSAFSSAGCGVAVLEVGLGGRLDATNATDPHVSAIASIGHDHTAVLGTQLAAIAREKAGIVRPGRVVVLSRQRPAVMTAVRAVAAAASAVLREVGPLTQKDATGYGLAVRGVHQRSNAALAIAAAVALGETGIVPAPSRSSITRGLGRVRWPGRFEVVPGPPTLVLDGAHNPEAGAALADTLRREFRGAPMRLVVGMLADKDAAAFARALRPLARAVYVTQPAGARALEAQRLAPHYGRRARTFTSAREAVAAAKGDALAGEIVCVTGSLALVGEVRDLLGLPIPERLW